MSGSENSNEDANSPLLEYLKAAHVNSQETIRALDAKIGVISGFSLLAIGGWFSIMQWLLENHSDSILALWRDHICRWFVLLPYAAIVLFSTVSIIFSILAIVGRPKKDFPFHILFPYHRKSEKKMARHIIYDEVAASSGFHVHEYREQLLILGGILEKKIRNIHFACVSLIGLFSCLIIIFLAGLLLYWLGIIPPAPPTPSEATVLAP